MKAFLAALVALAVIGAATWSILDRNLQQYSEEKYTTRSVRLPTH